MAQVMDPRIQGAMFLSNRPELGGEMTTFQLHKLITDDEAGSVLWRPNGIQDIPLNGYKTLATDVPNLLR